jgi:hypothetical protein
MHRYINNKGRFISSRDLKTNPHTNSIDIGAGKTPQEEVQGKPMRLQKKDLELKNHYWGRYNVNLLKELNI